MHSKYRNFIIFCSIGVLNTVVDISFYLLLRSSGTTVLFANIISTSVALLISYFLNRKYTFKSTTNPRSNIVPFLIVTLVGLWVLQPVVIYFSLNLLKQLSIQSSAQLDLVAKLIATAFTLVWNYVLYKKVVFSKAD